MNLLNKLRKRDKMRGLPIIVSLFRNEFDKLNNTRARMLDSIYHAVNIMPINDKMATIVGILTFMSMINFMHSQTQKRFYNPKKIHCALKNDLFFKLQ